MLHQVVEVLKHHLRQKCLSLLREAGGEAVLYSYSADATPLKVSTRKVHTTAGGQVVRQGRALEDFLLQRGLVKTTLATGEQRIAFLFGDILPLSEGKKSGNIFSAAALFFPMLRKAGHIGICISHVCADRALFSSLDRMSRQRLSAYYSPGVGPDLGDERVLLELTDWAVGTGCCAHDMQNGLKWALSSVATPEDIQNLHIVVESLRNSFDLLLARLPEFLVKHLAFAGNRADTDAVAGFWRDLGVEAGMVDQVAEVNPWWENGQLQVSSALSGDADAIEKVSHILLYLCKWRQFSESRWCTVGPCCRTLLWGLCVGLEAWVGIVRADPSTSDFYLHGFGKLSQGIKQYCVVASIASFVPDAVLAEVLVDDRILKHASRLQGTMFDEVGWVEDIGSFTWDRLGAASGYLGEVWELRQLVIHGSHVAAAFIDDKIFSQLKEYPWSLAVGDIPENLDALAASTEPIRDSCTHKIRLLLQMGFNRSQLVAAVSLFKEIPWSSIPVEQSHASAAVLHRFHPEYSVEMLATRATLHQMRHLFQDPAESRVEARAAHRLQKLKHKVPEKVSGKHAFLAHLFSSAKEHHPSGSKLPVKVVRDIVSQHSRLFLELPAARQAAFHREALENAAGRAIQLQEDILHYTSAAKVNKARLSADLLEEGLMNRVTSVRFAAEDFRAIQFYMQAADFQTPEIAHRRTAAMKAPSVPPAEVLDTLERCPTYAAPKPESALPEWLKRLCWHRDSVVERGAVFATSWEEGSEAFYFLFATQKPLSPHFQPLLLKDLATPCLEGASGEECEQLSLAWDQYVFEGRPGAYVEGSQLPFPSGEGVMVLQGLSYTASGRLVTNLQPISLESFLHLLPSKTKQPRAKAAQRQLLPKDLPQDSLSQYPWLAEFGQQGEASSSLGPEALDPQAPQPLADEADAETVLEGVWGELEEKRKEWAAEAPVQGDSFAVEVVDWAWTKGQAGRAYLCIEGRAAKGDATAWCRRYQLNAYTSFSAKLYGEEVARALAVEWCRRMQHFFDLYRCQPARDFKFLPDHKASLEDSTAFELMKSGLPTSGKAAARANVICALFPVLK